jgi:hypothetical protein
MWMISDLRRSNSETAENGRFSHSFLPRGLTVPKGEDCYTFEGVASRPDEIRTYYYHYYKRISVGMKEEAKWS